MTRKRTRITLKGSRYEIITSDLRKCEARTLLLLAEGKTQQEICQMYGLHKNTLAAQMSRVRDRLNTSTSVESVAAAFASGIITARKAKQPLIVESRRYRLAVESISPDTLTTAQCHTLLWITEGKTLPEIGLILDVTSRTVDSHAQEVRRKLGANTTAEAVAKAFSQGMITHKTHAQEIAQ